MNNLINLIIAGIFGVLFGTLILYFIYKKKILNYKEFKRGVVFGTIITFLMIISVVLYAFTNSIYSFLILVIGIFVWAFLRKNLNT